LFELVVGAAFGAEVAGAGGSAEVVGPRVVEVTHVGWAAAGGVAAGLVAGGDEFGDPGWWPVGGGGEVVGASAGLLVLGGSVGGFLRGPLSGCEGLVEDLGEGGAADLGG
jgi:hypothetical protein